MSASSVSTSRRRFLQTSVLSSAVFGAERGLSGAESRQAGDNKGKPRNVIMMVSDGMNHGALSLARQYQLLVDQKECHWMNLYRQLPVVRCLAETFSANSCVTDSAAAASAWGSGNRVHNGRLNVGEGDQAFTTLHQKLQASGRKTGLVTTATITHATPAGFAANMNSRADEELIAVQYLEREVDVLLGGGQKFFSEDLRGNYAAAGYEVVTSRRDLGRLTGNSGKRVLGIFSEGHLPYSIDHNHVPALAEKVPTLVEMTEVALERLRHHADGFFLMVEGARIDHAGHANDAAASIHDQIAFDDTIGTVLKFIEKHPDTLLIVTTDHGCGGIQMNGVSVEANQGFGPGLYNASNAYFDRLRGFNRSFEWMKDNGVNGLSGEKLGVALRQFTGLNFSKEELKLMQGLKAGISGVLAAHHGVNWTSGNHTGELVEFCAFGPGSHLFPAFIKNVEVHQQLLTAFDLPVG